MWPLSCFSLRLISSKMSGIVREVGQVVLRGSDTKLKCWFFAEELVFFLFDMTASNEEEGS